MGGQTLNQRPTGQAWRNIKKKMYRARIAQGLNPIPEAGWEYEYWNHYVTGNSPIMNREPVEDEDVRVLQIEVERLKKQVLSEATVREVILGLAKPEVNPPGWLMGDSTGHKMNGVPTLMLSDLHWGEVVNPDEIGGVNEYNLEIAHNRLEKCFDTTIKLLRDYFKEANYPGIVIALGGDMVSGDIHEELRESNATQTMCAVLDLRDCLVDGIKAMADEFGKVFLPCVAGNHGRLDKKPRAKGRAFTNWDWMTFQLLEKAFEKDDRVQFLIPSGPDANYRIYNTRFCLTHGDQFRGGDGMIGHMGPLIRGDRKKRNRNSQVGLGFDVMLHGHFHTYSPGPMIVGNGSMIGYNEYANSGNFSYEDPKQALFMTHKDRGVIWHMAVNLADESKSHNPEWVSVFKS